MGRLHLPCWCRHSPSPVDWPRRRAGLRGPGWQTSGKGGRLRLLGGGCPGLLWLWCGPARKVVASCLHRPPISRAKTTSRHLLERRSSGHVRSLELRASWSAAPVYCPARLRGWLEEVRGDTWRYQSGVDGQLRPPPPTMGVRWL